ncbi:hypothetical protein [Balneatrix alpica]|uniref:Uncharacterized protein n=1 Tax=Balneatrix alpica TaxID=75684 RepID=A0ABV5ZF02_9GAMM|nr:hypothetical protein [Balneatrix alpica]
MLTLERITTEYCHTQDRIRLAAEAADGSLLTLWLTNRLANRLLPHLMQWLEQQGSEQQIEQLQAILQHQAEHQVTPQQPVPAQAGQHILIQSIDITSSQEQLLLTFQPLEGESSRLAFTPTPLRQWLSILRHTYLQADWTFSSWPLWLQEGEQVHSTPTTLH